MKLITLIFTIIFFFGINTSIANNLAYIDLNLIINNSIAGKNVIKKINEVNDKNLEILKKDQLELNKQKNEIEKTRNILSDIEFNQNLSDLNDKIEKFKKKQETMSIEFKDLRQSEINGLITRINPIIEKFMIENKIDLILKKENVYISISKFDITDDLIDLINQTISK